ncbi:alpha/beta fold hydrolase [Paenibacillus sp. 481]|uniref:alpha/beta fold hydrolase n=1 Tax=Paenibacillus sp. 481 TaxID=2835869 RepID=UPI001E3F87D2|nr:alpha/beta fold hydrolase [Paenibacillus sp. 481]UHA74667.1 alpha/beta fold hydrolase [Paenibacillus sp. 481]
MGVEKARLIKVVSRSTKSKLAVIFVHGLAGDPHGTWRKCEQSPTMMELLGQDPSLLDAEIYSYGYRTGFKPLQYDFKTVAELLHGDIQVDLKGKDIVFVAHSMGGLVVQQYIVNRYEDFDEDNLKSIKGAVYLSVPFHGSGLANVFPKWTVNRQLQSLRKNSPHLAQLEASWNKYVYRGGTEKLPEKLKHDISQLALRGARDRVVAEASSTPLYLGADVVNVDEDHSSICKADPSSTAYKTIRDFVQKTMESQATKPTPMIFHIHGYDKQQYAEQPQVELDWREYFGVYASPRKLPSRENWSAMTTALESAADHWAQNRAATQGYIRIYTKICLSGGVLIGSRFSRVRGAIIEIEQGEYIWSSLKSDPSFIVSPDIWIGNDLKSSRAILVLSVTRDIKEPVHAHLKQTNVQYHTLINVLPPTGVGHDSIASAEQAVAYAVKVKAIVDDLKQRGIEHIDLYLNCPISVAVFVGHHLTAVGPIQVFDFQHPGYVPACLI